MSSEDRLEGVKPTRMELIELRIRLSLAEKGYSLLSEKLESLTNELFTVLSVHKEIRDKISDAIQEVTPMLAAIRMTMGPSRTKQIALATPQTKKVSSNFRSLMGVRVPIIELLEEPISAEHLPYHLADTSAQLDEAQETFKSMLKLLVSLAESQSALTRLANEIADTKRRVNALNYIVIPRIRNTVEWITFTLAEQEREEFVRLKKVKTKIERSSEEGSIAAI
ncbi:MAG: V-type ATP synthase subunit D [Candidatus Heimdallarchaeota archaeon]